MRWRDDPFSVREGFQQGQARTQRLPLVVDGERADVLLHWRPPFDSEGPVVEAALGGARIGLGEEGGPSGTFVAADRSLYVLRHGRQTLVAPFDPFAVDLEHIGEVGGLVRSPMHGKVVAILVAPGDPVVKGQRLAVVEAMKMEHALVAPADGSVEEVRAEPGQQVAEGAPVVVLSVA